MQSYSVQDVERLLHLSRGTIRGLVQAGFVKPSRGARREYQFSFQDLIVLRAARALIDAKLPRRRIRRALDDLRQHLPDEVPLSGLSISAVGEQVVVREGRNQFQAVDGQYLLGLDDPAREVRFSIVGLESPQRTFGAALPRTDRVQFPGTVVGFQRNLKIAAMICKDLFGLDPEKKVLMGGSHGAWLSVMSMLMQPDFAGSGVRMERRKRFETFGYNSRPVAIVPWQLAYPDFRKIASPTGITFDNATIAGTAVTGAAGAFAHYRFSTTGDVMVITGGTATHGTYPVAAKNSDNVHLTLGSSAGAGTASGYLSTDQTSLHWSSMVFGTRPENAAGADGLEQYLEWDTLPKSLIDTASAQKWAEDGYLTFAVPSFFISFESLITPSTGIHPYGSPWSNFDIHDWHGARDLSAMLTSKGKSSTFTKYNDLSEWNSGARPAQIYDWLVAQLEAAA